MSTQVKKLVINLQGSFKSVKSSVRKPKNNNHATTQYQNKAKSYFIFYFKLFLFSQISYNFFINSFRST